ncbi:MAG: Fur family transcriptional regulator [Pseudomonadota bacterium]
MSETLSRLEKRCAERGLRMTDTRRLVVSLLSKADDHPDAEELHQRARDIDPSISLATVYRTLKLLEEFDLVERHDFRDGRSRYEEADKDHHDHLIDLESGEVVEFFDEELEALKNTIAERLGYDLKDHRLELYGSRRKSSR